MDLRHIPSIDRLLRDHPELAEQFGRARATQALRQATSALRRGEGSPESLTQAAQALLEAQDRPSLRRVLNATGVILHTNLGRAPLAPRALEQVLNCAGYSNLELDLETGERGSRYAHVRSLLQTLTGAPAALVVNNCAAAMMLIVEVLARGREVIVSRGELVEIGGSFRVPDILARGGARLIEVGTTNRTRIEDFRRAITPETGLLLSTHLSNFAMSGFVESPQPKELAALGREFTIPSCLDLGSGLLRPHPLLEEPSVEESLAAGFDLVAFSGDKLLGATQAGIVLGRTDLIERLAADPLNRALRVDKLTLAGLEGTLRMHLQGQPTPVQEMLELSQEELKKRAQRLARRLSPGVRASVHPGESSVGGGTHPGKGLPTWVVRVQVEREEPWAARLRQGEPALLVRRGKGFLELDVRTLRPEDFALVVQALEQAHS